MLGALVAVNALLAYLRVLAGGGLLGPVLAAGLGGVVALGVVGYALAGRGMLREGKAVPAGTGG